MSRFISYLNSCNCRVSSSKEEQKENKKETKLVVYYDIQDISSPTPIFSDLGNSIKSVSVDEGVPVQVNSFETRAQSGPPVKVYQFSSVGEHVIKYEFDDTTLIGEGPLFMNVLTIDRIVIPNAVTNIRKNAFNGCSANNITIPNGVAIIGEASFNGCYNLRSINIPNSVMIINKGAFNSCNNLVNVIIGNGIKTIGGGSFYCPNLADITINAIIPPQLQLSSVSFENNFGGSNIYVPAESVDAYKSAENWSACADSIFPIE